ncbi:hypothetical protein PHMEG_00014015 [Phytophthora megakarya]|uniref:Uncharacterized protein n=1 Tax=Phytophthora megakarya TaxID=4795 RepID=A0A225W4U7_9STRA|nr:hypothetical protein PHMEG_00014015 [Phytophthora megakarya]
MINDILHHRERKSMCKSSGRSPHGAIIAGEIAGGTRNRSAVTAVTNTPEMTVITATSRLTVLNETSATLQTGQNEIYQHDYDELDGRGQRYGDDGYANEGSEYGNSSDDERGHVAAAKSHERRTAAEGTYTRYDNRRPRNDTHFNNDRH